MSASGSPAPLTLSVDCGGGGIKAAVLDAAGTAHAPAVRVPTPYPLSPELLVDTVAGLARGLPPADRVSLGMPGMIRHGVVIHTPHYITRTGPRSRIDPELRERWSGFDARAALERRLGVPVLVLNDAEIHGAGVVAGTGLELVLTLGTGLGSAHFDGGRVAPHLELSHAPVRRGTTYDAYIGEIERHRLGDGLWSRRVARVVDGLRPVFLWDRLYIGGGNSRRITQAVLDRLGDEVVIVPNSAALVGGARAWDLFG
ncbi:ROK family protein [Sanguibacter sp. 4.1]|uniref:ROK family protein n=1 Tax=Sanguibacter biliveldensis TaxID=3030830 RepID=A0AAF0Z340_9MICO|nr:ROK family protein [Sanguibacter sp. 4.1]WPF81570.1 ROK family protein [Sanguibacter sp. 4.1]